MKYTRFTFDDDLNEEINYWVQRKGWNPAKIIVSEKYRQEVNTCQENCGLDCNRCAMNDGYDEESVEVSPITSKEKITFKRYASHQIGHVWGNWYLAKV